LTGVTDEILASKAANGDLRAFEELLARYRVMVYRLARSITRNHDDADDAAQETFIRVHRALGNYDPKRPFKPWIRKIAYNTSLNVLKKSRTSGRKVSMESMESIVDHGPGPDKAVETYESQLKVNEALETLSQDLRTTFLMRSVEGMSYKEISVMTGVRMGTVMSRLSRARSHILEVMRAGGVLHLEGD